MTQSMAAIQNGTITKISINGCMLNGGRIGSALSDTTAIAIPISEFNASTGDIIQVSGTTGNSTSLVDFYQGDIDFSGETTILDQSMLLKIYTISVTGCKMKADSGIATMSIIGSNSINSGVSLRGKVKD